MPAAACSGHYRHKPEGIDLIEPVRIVDSVRHITGDPLAHKQDVHAILRFFVRQWADCGKPGCPVIIVSGRSSVAFPLFVVDHANPIWFAVFGSPIQIGPVVHLAAIVGTDMRLPRSQKNESKPRSGLFR